MDNLTTALRPMTRILNWIRLALASAAFCLAFHVTHPQAHPASHSPGSEVVARLSAQSPEFDHLHTTPRD